MLKLRTSEVEAQEAFVTALPVPAFVMLCITNSPLVTVAAIFAAYMTLVLVMEIIRHK